MARLRVEFMHRIGPADLVFSVRFGVWSFEWPLRIPMELCSNPASRSTWRGDSRVRSRGRTEILHSSGLR
jgi:hypothetical protein